MMCLFYKLVVELFHATYLFCYLVPDGDTSILVDNIQIVTLQKLS